MKRIDRGGSLASPRKLANGFLRVDGYLTRTGVFAYRQPNGSILREYRPPEEVFAQESMDSFAMVDVTIDHPPVMLNAQNSMEFSVGTTGESVRRDGKFLANALMLKHSAALDALFNGRVELSCGYEADVEMTPGTTSDGEKYDAIQRNIRGNHVALVTVGRAGPEVRVRLDAAVCEFDTQAEACTQEVSMTLEELQRKLAEAIAESAKQQARADGADAALANMTTGRDTMQAERDSARAELATEKQARQDAADGFDARVQDRVALEGRGRQVLGADQKFNGQSDKAVKIAIVKKLDGDDVAADASDVYVNGRFEKSDAALAATRAGTEQTRNDAAPQDQEEDLEAKARKNMLADLKNASKKGA